MRIRKMKIKLKHSGLTLIEVLVSVTIIAILAAGLFAVGNYIDTQMKIERTKSTINLLVAALDQYFDFYHKFPDPNGALEEYRTGCANDDNDIERLYYKLTLAPDAKKILDQVNRKFLKDSDDDENPEIVDAWNENLRFRYIDGWNFPVIISAGPDKDFGDHNPKKTEDNISSKGL